MIPRLFVEAPLGAGASVELDAGRAHYVRDVLRLGAGAPVLLFNGHHGEWRASIDSSAKRLVSLRVDAQTRAQVSGPDLWLCFAPVKKARLDFIAEKATELGASVLQPVMTRHTAVTRVNTERLRANAIEAAEQTERLDVPEVRAPETLERLVAAWPADRHLLLADESGGGLPIAQCLAGLEVAARGAPWAVLTGPEGGFARDEIEAIGRLPRVHRVGLGPRILRADTAIVAALAVWQALLGDWREAPPRRSVFA